MALGTVRFDDADNDGGDDFGIWFLFLWGKKALV